MKPYDPYSDLDCINAFIENNEQEFGEFCALLGTSPNNDPGPAERFCQRYERRFLAFGERYAESLIAEEADRKNDYDKAHQVSDE